MHKKIQLLLACSVTILMLCVKGEDQIGRTNSFDPSGDNYHPPTITAMADTTVFIKDSVYLHASAADVNGLVNRYLWAMDGKHFLDTSNSNSKLHIFASPGKDTILVSAIDTNGLKANIDTIVVTVRLGRPVISVKPDSMVIATGDSLTLIASDFDTNGIIKALYWAMDGVNFSATTPKDSIKKVAFSTQGSKMVLVKAMDDDSLVAYDTVLITVRDPAPLIFAPLPNAQLAYNNTTLQWQPGLYNDHFQVLLDTVNPPIAIVNYSTHDTFMVESNLAYSKSYWWEVIGFDKTGLYASSTIWKFTTSQKPPDKPLLSAMDLDSATIAVQWNKISGATSYTLQNASDSTGPFAQLYSGVDTTYSQTGLPKNQKVWYRVQAVNTTQTSEWSDTVMSMIVSLTGTWVGTWEWSGQAFTCTINDGGEFSMVLIQNGDSLSGSTSGGGIQTIYSDCTIESVRSDVGTVSGTISGATLNLSFGFGTTLNFTGVATLKSDTLSAVFTRNTTGGQGSFALIRLF
jgi:hypothetical protein